jgi:hypothetical protein
VRRLWWGRAATGRARDSTCAKIAFSVFAHITRNPI